MSSVASESEIVITSPEVELKREQSEREQVYKREGFQAEMRAASLIVQELEHRGLLPDDAEKRKAAAQSVLDAVWAGRVQANAQQLMGGLYENNPILYHFAGKEVGSDSRYGSDKRVHRIDATGLNQHMLDMGTKNLNDIKDRRSLSGLRAAIQEGKNGQQLKDRVDQMARDTISQVYNEHIGISTPVDANSDRGRILFEAAVRKGRGQESTDIDGVGVGDAKLNLDLTDYQYKDLSDQDRILHAAMVAGVGIEERARAIKKVGTFEEISQEMEQAGKLPLDESERKQAVMVEMNRRIEDGYGAAGIRVGKKLGEILQSKDNPMQYGGNLVTLLSSEVGRVGFNNDNTPATDYFKNIKRTVEGKAN